MSQKEATARIKINDLLKEAGWILDPSDSRCNVQVESNTTITSTEIDEFGDDFENVSKGFIDYLLLDEQGRPLVILEAKSGDKDPLVGKEQARSYAKGQNVSYAILSNGYQHYFWNIEEGNPQPITKFPTQQSLNHQNKFIPIKDNLLKEVIEDDYIAITQNSKYLQRR